MSSIDPNSARTAEDFVMLLRQARAMSELSFWELEKRANAAGYELEPAVLAETLGLAELPDGPLVASLLHACGYPEEEIEQWLSVRDRLAAPQAALTATLPAMLPAAPPATTAHEAAFTAELPAADRHTAPPGAHPAGNTASGSHPIVPRPRHNLRIPGRGTRRAPGSLLRPLVMAAAAALIGIGSIAVILSAVKDDDVADPPVYATGTPPRTADPGQPATSQTPTASPAAASPTATTPSPSPSTTIVAATGVLRSGTVTLQNGQSIDLDGGGTGPDIIASGVDSIRADPSGRHFALVATATKQACAASNDYQKTMQGLTPGKGVCVRTDKGLYGHITITGTAPLAFSYVVWS